MSNPAHSSRRGRVAAIRASRGRPSAAFFALALGAWCVTWGMGCGEAGTPGGATAGPEGASVTRAEVRTTFHPTAYWARRIVGDLVPVVNPCPPDADPARWKPEPEEIAAYQNARLIIVNGGDFEGWVAMAALPRSRVVVTTDDFADELIESDATTHSHGPAGTHAHGPIDGHTWLEPRNAIRQADAIRAALVRAFPEHAAAFEHGYAALEADLRALDADLEALEFADRPMLANHAAYDYVARRFGWRLTNLDVDPDATGDAMEAALESVRTALAAVAESSPSADAATPIMLWESAPNAPLAAAVEALGVRHVVFAPAETVAEGEDYLGVMRANVARLAEALR